MGQGGHRGGQKGAREGKKGAREGKKGAAPFYFSLAGTLLTIELYISKIFNSFVRRLLCNGK